MIRRFYFKRRSALFYLSFIILSFTLISIIFLPSSNIDLNNKYENFSNGNDDINFKIQTSSSNPPNKYYFNYYKAITIDRDMVYGSGNHINFPVLISILDSDLHDHVNQSNGNDIAFANETDWLDHEIEVFNQAYNATHARLIAWVRIPSLSTSINTTIYIFYGNATMSSRQNPTSVWNSSYQGVWHLAQLSGSVNDSTSYSTSGTVSGTVNRSAFGQINGGFDFVSNGMINFGDPSCLDMGTDSFTVSFWINIHGSTGGYQLPIYKGATTEFDRGYDFETSPDGSVMTFRISDGDGNLQDSDILDVDFNSWMHVFGVVNRTSNLISIFKNGLEVGTGNGIASIGNLDNNFNLLASWAPAMDIDGLLDEIKISNKPLSAGWIRTEYYNQYNPQSFFTLSTEVIIDIKPPTYSYLIESSDPLELGQTEVIQINVTDPSDIFQVKILYEGLNHSMTNIGGDKWEYNTWIPNTVGNYTYIIYMQDNMKNWNSTKGVIEVIDTTSPNYSNLIESSDPLELGQSEVIQINVSDIAGIFQVKIEFEGINHSMTNIGDTIWQYNSWTPSNWIIHQYRIYMEDNNGNWNSLTNNITVQDTIIPSPPILTNSPSGTVSGNLVFDWLDGTDSSGISYYILIIDNEPDPLTTPGYVYKLNITNLGPESSYYELTGTLLSGKYYYFLAQIDGAGHQSSYTMGSFTINLNSSNNNIMIYIIVGVIASSAIGSISVITIVRKRSHKKLGPPRKKLPLKVILGHITKLSPPELISEENELQNLFIQKDLDQSSSKELPDEEDIEISIEKIKDLGEELFSEGAYLEAIKQFHHVKDFLLKHGRNEEAALITELLAGIEGLIEEREKRLEILEQVKLGGNSVQIFELYNEIIDISKNLRDHETASFFQSELNQFFQSNELKLRDLTEYRNILEKKADSLLNNNQFEMAAQIYGKCERISEIFIKSERDGEIVNFEKFRNKKAYCSNKFKEKKFYV